MTPYARGMDRHTYLSAVMPKRRLTKKFFREQLRWLKKKSSFLTLKDGDKGNGGCAKINDLTRPLNTTSTKEKSSVEMRKLFLIAKDGDKGNTGSEDTSDITSHMKITNTVENICTTAATSPPKLLYKPRRPRKMR